MTSIENAAVSSVVAGQLTLLDLLALTDVGPDRYRATAVFDEPEALYGGQVAAQALLAAGSAVAPDRQPHSLHGYYLRGGSAARPTDFHVERDRDGRSFSVRRVVATQDDAVIFTLTASFHRQEPGQDRVDTDGPLVPPAEDLPVGRLPRLFSVESRVPPQPFPGAVWPTRFWARCTIPLPATPLVQACALTYLSDISSGLLAWDDDEAATGPSLDHALWFHRPARMDEWVLVDLVPRTIAGGRGWYDGGIRTADGALAVTIAQEALFRFGRRPPGWNS
ncbi:acyl-CoA thioesterase [Cryptosporangium aurantiacum]|uniref:Acyl-CoA thioesterase-2 n=1 Tax=Cryptosporangium aurantiacum TaxID=134849 RepID=A0A1M7PLE6_9ACTN|nr:acyl-CoA thioesterase domain-containing protein [Cryptosporangium aurantiacum]SHN17849.1 acyl-CoA thioesterase-2 [Cryptosporangium aurantiacum]